MPFATSSILVAISSNLLAMASAEHSVRTLLVAMHFVMNSDALVTSSFLLLMVVIRKVLR